MTSETAQKMGETNERDERGVIGFVGLGRMGRQMAERLSGAGFALQVWNRTRARAEDLRGARVCESPRAAATGARLVLSSLADDVAALAVVLGDDGVLVGLDEGAVHISLSTISPGLARTPSSAGATTARFRDLLACRYAVLCLPSSGSLAPATREPQEAS